MIPFLLETGSLTGRFRAARAAPPRPAAADTQSLRLI